jgi:hypothetical protein
MAKVPVAILNMLATGFALGRLDGDAHSPVQRAIISNRAGSPGLVLVQVEKTTVDKLHCRLVDYIVVRAANMCQSTP